MYRQKTNITIITLMFFIFTHLRTSQAISPINDTIKQRIVGKSWTETCPIPLEDLRYLTIPYWGYDDKQHQGEMIVHKDVVQEVITIFAELLEAKFPIESMRLVDDFFQPGMSRSDVDTASMLSNNTSAFFYRCISNTKIISEHCLGTAIDINPLVNPFVRGDYVCPAESKGYCDRTRTDIKGFLTPESICVTLFLKHGWNWAGAWKKVQDYQHFCKVQTESLQ